MRKITAYLLLVSLSVFLLCGNTVYADSVIASNNFNGSTGAAGTFYYTPNNGIADRVGRPGGAEGDRSARLATLGGGSENPDIALWLGKRAYTKIVISAEFMADTEGHKREAIGLQLTDAVTGYSQNRYNFVVFDADGYIYLNGVSVIPYTAGEWYAAELSFNPIPEGDTEGNNICLKITDESGALTERSIRLGMAGKINHFRISQAGKEGEAANFYIDNFNMADIENGGETPGGPTPTPSGEPTPTPTPTPTAEPTPASTPALSGGVTPPPGSGAATVQGNQDYWSHIDQNSGNNVMNLPHHTYYSTLMNVDAGYYLYLPRGYNDAANADINYPVIYMLHFLHGNETSLIAHAWTLDNLIKNGKIPPALAVFVCGGGDNYYHDSPNGAMMSESTVIKELIPHIDETYRTIASKEGRALNGFSMGGYGAFKLSFEYPEMFSNIVTYAADLHDLSDFKNVRGTIMGGECFQNQDYFYEEENPFEHLRKNAGNIKGNGLKIRMYAGTEDYTLRENREMDKTLTRLGIEHDFYEIEGYNHGGAYYQNYGTKGFIFNLANMNYETGGFTEQVDVIGKVISPPYNPGPPLDPSKSLMSGAVCSVSSSLSDGTAPGSNVSDGIEYTAWANQRNAAAPHTASFEFGRAVRIDAYRILSGISKGGAVNGLYLEYFDGADWAQVPGSSEILNIDTDLRRAVEPPVITGKVRVSFTDGEIRVREICFYGEDCSEGLGEPETFSVYPPEKLSASEISDGGLKLSWEQFYGSADGFVIYRDGEETARVTASEYRDGAVTPGQVYTYKAQAYTGSGLSPVSGEIKVKIPTAEKRRNILLTREARLNENNQSSKNITDGDSSTVWSAAKWTAAKTHIINDIKLPRLTSIDKLVIISGNAGGNDKMTKFKWQYLDKYYIWRDVPGSEVLDNTDEAAAVTLAVPIIARSLKIIGPAWGIGLTVKEIEAYESSLPLAFVTSMQIFTGNSLPLVIPHELNYAKAEIFVSNDGDFPKNAAVMLALYENGVLKDIKISGFNQISPHDADGKITVELNTTESFDFGGECYLKLFAWNESGGLIPLSPVLTRGKEAGL
jgi:endo-1,4-beta-xylanase